MSPGAPAADAGSRAWEASAACRARNADLWFTRRYTSTALAICAACPVLDSCRAAVLHRERNLPRCDRQGIVAGLTGAQRHALEQSTDHLPGPTTPPLSGPSDDDASTPPPERPTVPSHRPEPGRRRAGSSGGPAGSPCGGIEGAAPGEAGAAVVGRKSGTATPRSVGPAGGTEPGRRRARSSGGPTGSPCGGIEGAPPGEAGAAVVGRKSGTATPRSVGPAGGTEPGRRRARSSGGPAGSPRGEIEGAAPGEARAATASGAGWHRGDRGAGSAGTSPRGSAGCVDEAPQAVLSRHGSARSIAGPTGSGRSERPAAPSHRTVGDPPSGRPGDPTDARHPPPGRSGDGRQERGARNPGPRLAPCGTRAAYQRHLRRGEFVDEACRDANARGAGRYRRTGSTRDRTDETRPRAAARAATADTPS